MTWTAVCVTCVAMATITLAGRIITVVDENFLNKNSDLEEIIKPNAFMNTDMTVIISNDNDTETTFDEVCQALSEGAFMLLDIASPNVGPLLRSFARAHGLVFLTMIDISEELVGDRDDPYYIRIEPPGSSMLNVVSDIILKDNLTNVAILYDDSFKLHQIPRRLVTGLLSHHIYHEIRRNEIKHLLDHLFDLEIENVIVIGSATSIDFVLGQANEHAEELREYMDWFAITKDAKITCDHCLAKMRTVVATGAASFEMMNNYIDYCPDAKITCDHCLAKMRTVVATGAASFEMRNNYIDYMRNFYRGYNSLHIKIDETFVYDLLRVFDEHLPDDPGLIKSNSCYSDVITGTVDGELIVDSLENINHEGVFGQMVSSGGVIEQKIKLNIRRVIFNQGKELESTSLGHWTEDGGLNVTVDSLTRERSQKNYKVVIVPEYEPFIYKHTSYVNGTLANYTYTGFCIELFDKIAEVLGFTYDVHETADGFFGSLNEDGTWNGAIQELIEKKADIAIGPISVMSERENVVDFTVPFHEPVGLTILMRKQEFEYSLHRFLKVLEANVWGVIVAAYFLFAILMWVFDKFSPYSYQNDPDGSSGPEKRVFTLKEGIWFCMTSLTPQGGGEAPKAISGRILAAFWWLYGFLLIAFYTANLAAFLTVTRLETPISSLDDLSNQQSVKYGPMNGTSALVYFQRMSEIEDRFYTIWKGMSLNDSLSPVDRAKLAVWDYPVSEKFTKLYERMHVPNSYAEALRMVKAKEFAFIDDATRNKYQTLIDCDVEAIGVEFSRKPFAFAVTQGSPLRAQMSNVILELANKRFMEDLTNKWWESNKLKKECPTIEDESDGISLMNIGGVFLVIAIGTGMSLIAFVVEYYIYKIKPTRESRLYDINRRGGIEAKPPEVNVNDLQIDVTVQNGGSKIPKNEIHAENNHKRMSSKLRLRNGTNKPHKQNGYISNKQNHENNKDIDDNDNHKVSNGHVQNGGSNHYFIFDTDDTIEERYPSIRQQEEAQNVVMTHI